MKRRASALVAAAGLGATAVSVALVAAAPAAYAGDVTNPAQNPAPVTVTIDGQTYHDGLDTLPGYDDYACTAIPNVQYDFGGNQVDYYDDDGNLLNSVHWTEWSRISSYQTWLKQQHSSSAPSSPAKNTGTRTKTSAPSHAASSPARTGGGSTKRNSSSSAGDGPSAGGSSSGRGVADSGDRASAAGVSTKGSTTAGGTATNAASSPATGSSSASGAAAGSDGDTNVAAPVPASGPGSPAGSQPAAALAAKNVGEKIPSGLGRGAGDTRLAGVGVLAALAAVSLAVLVGGVLRRRLFGRRGLRGAHT